MPPLTNRFYTPEEYLAFEERSELKHEYYRGVIREMEGGSRAHNQICRKFFAALFSKTNGAECYLHLSVTLIKVVATGLYTHADLSVACKPLEYEPGSIEVLLNPRVLIEVLSPSTEAYDRTTKFDHYRKIPSLQEFIFASQFEPLIHHYTRQSSDQWLLTTVAGLEATLRLSSIDCELTLAQIYKDVEFAAVEQCLREH